MILGGHEKVMENFLGKSVGTLNDTRSKESAVCTVCTFKLYCDFHKQ